MLTVGPTKIEVMAETAVLGDARLHRLHGLWHAARVANGDALPDHGFVDPLQLRFIIGSLLLFDVQPDPLRFRYRLVGTDVVDHLGIELTGMWLDQHPDVQRIDRITATLELAWCQQSAVHFTYALMSFKRRWPCESLVLPLAGLPDEMPLLLVGQVFPKDMPRFRRSLEDAG
jgi:hypothetical protein